MMKKIFLITVITLNSSLTFSQWIRLTNPPNWDGGNRGYQMLDTDIYFIAYGISGDFFTRIARTTNGGQSWEMIYADSMLWTDGISMGKWKFVTKDSALLSTNRNKLYYTTDGCKTVKPCTTAPNDTNSIIAINRFTRDIFFYSENHLYRTSDLGVTNLLVKADSSSGVGSIQFISPDIGFGIGSNKKILKTTDGGLNWTIVTTLSTVPNKMTWINNNICFINDFYIPRKSVDGGKTWEVINNGLPSFQSGVSQIGDMYFGDSLHGWLIQIKGLFVSSSIYKTIDGGLNWYQLIKDDYDCTLGSMTGIDNNIIVFWPAHARNCIYKTLDGGGPTVDMPEIFSENSTSNYSIFPNPATNILYLTCTGSIPCYARAEVISLQGQLMLSKEIKASETEIDISTLPNGIYLVKIVDEHGVWVRKVVKE